MFFLLILAIPKEIVIKIIGIALEFLQSPILLLILLSMQSGTGDILTLPLLDNIIIKFILQEVLKMPVVVILLTTCGFSIEVLLRFVVLEQSCLVQLYTLVRFDVRTGVAMGAPLGKLPLDGSGSILSVKGLSEFG